ncbi:MAG: CDP-glycerol glycerophosphotransferase family protein, partial [Candidatus Thorarchaeota archaeon]
QIIRFLDYFYPKDSRIILFGSNSGLVMSGSPKALFLSLTESYPKYKSYFNVRKPTQSNQINVLTLRGFILYLKAKFLVSSHGSNDFKFLRNSRKKVHVTTWHGLPLKAIGLGIKSLTKKQLKGIIEYSSLVDYYICNSKYEMRVLSALFNFDIESAWLIGTPRNDCLTQVPSSIKKILRNMIPEMSHDSKVLLYAPTFRPITETNKDGSVRLFPFDDINKTNLADFLERNDAYLLIRMHINDKATRTLLDNPRVIELGFDVLPDVNPILPEVDIVITDYSSIAYDFLLLDRPIIYIPYDLEEYMKNPGLIVNDFDFWTPGIKISSLAEFISYSNDMFNGKPDSFSNHRDKLRKIIHNHQTPDTVSRFIKLLEQVR